MATVFQEFLNANEGRNYPLHDSATRIARSGIVLPNSLLVDANIWMPKAAGKYIFLSSAAVTSSLVTLTFSAVSDSPICGSPSSVFTPLAVLSLPKPVIRFKNYALTPYMNGVGGWVMLGKAATDNETFSLLFDPEAGFLLDRVVRAYQPSAVPTLGKVGVTPPLQGLVLLQGLGGGITTKGAVRNIDGVDRIVGLIGLTLGNSPVNTLLGFAGDCGHRPSSKDCNKPPITSINDVKPDCNGNIDIAFTGPVVIGDAKDGIVVDTIVGLNEVCPPDPYSDLISQTDDVCAPFVITGPSNQTGCVGGHATFSVSVVGDNPHYLWARSTDGGTTWSSIIGANSSSYTTPQLHLSNDGTLYRVLVSKVADWTTFDTMKSAIATLRVVECGSSLSSESSGSMSSESATPVGGFYCETFADSVANELTVTKGAFSIVAMTYFVPTYDQGYRYRSTAGYVQAEQVSIDFHRFMNSAATYKVSAKIRPRDSGNGHLVFGYAGENNFFTAGVLVSHPDYPNGAFYIAQRVANPLAGGGSLGLGNPGSRYVFLPGSVFPNTDTAHPLRNNDYFVTITVQKAGLFTVVSLLARWTNSDGTHGIMSQSYPIPVSPTHWTTLNDVAHAGLGVFSSETDFGDFGINCTGIMSSSLAACDSCITYASGLGQTRFLQGTGSISGGRLVSAAAMMAVRDGCGLGMYHATGGYKATSRFRPKINDPGCGVIFSMDEEMFRTGYGTYWFAGLVAMAVIDSPYGSFYIQQIQRSMSGETVLFSTYVPWFGPSLLPEVDYTFEVVVTRVAGTQNALIALKATWTSGGAQTVLLSHTTLIGDGILPDTIALGTAIGLKARRNLTQFVNLCGYLV